MKKKLTAKDKRIFVIGAAVIAVCLLVAGIYAVLNRSTSREATPGELEAHQAYDVDWQALTEEEKTDKQVILSLCTEAGEKTVGSNTYTTYTPNGVEQHLYKFKTLDEIILTDTAVMLSYTDADGCTVILSYDDKGLNEMAVYHPESDIMYHYINGVTTVWEKFYHGVHIG